MLQDEQYASRCFCHANSSAQRRAKYWKIDAEALTAGLPSKDSVHWLKYLVASLCAPFWKKPSLFEGASYFLGVSQTPVLDQVFQFR